MRVVPEKCGRCKFYRWDSDYRRDRKLCVLTEKIPEQVFSKEKNNWTIPRPSWCPLVDIGNLGLAL